jgi:vacuolar-type H+-ATPase subunit H
MLIQLIIIQVVTFLLIVLVLRKLLYTETAKEAQRLRVLREEYSKKEKELQVKIDEAAKDAAVKISKAEEEARKFLETKEKEAEAEKQEIVARARDKAEETIRAAINSKEKIREEIELEMKDEIPAAAVRIFKEALPAAAVQAIHDELITEVLMRIKKLEKDVFRVKSEKGELVSAYPLKKSEKDRIVSAISERTGYEVPLADKEDKELVAGVVVKLGSLVIDGSLENKLRQAEERLG